MSPSCSSSMTSPSKRPHGENRMNACIGIDVGGTGIKGGIVDVLTGKVHGEVLHVATPRPATPGTVTNAIARITQHLSRRGVLLLQEDLHVGVGFPAIVHKGTIRSAANIDESWIDVTANTTLTEYLRLPTVVLNDADAAGLAEARFGAGQGTTGVVLVITLGTGIGSALVINGILVPNLELGHLELGGTRVEKRTSAVARERQGIGWDDYSSRLQTYLQHLEFLFSPDLFIIGGGISNAAEKFIPKIKLRTPITPAQLKNQAGIVGAALQSSNHAH